jgi:hypothetical protein
VGADYLETGQVFPRSSCSLVKAIARAILLEVAALIDPD